VNTSPDMEAAQRALRTNLVADLNHYCDEIAVWRADKYSPEEMRGYLRGVKEVLDSRAEHEGIELPTRALDCALGEFEERRGIEPQIEVYDDRARTKGFSTIQSRLLKKMVREVRQFRIAFRQALVEFDYHGWYVPRQKKLWSLERKGVENWYEHNLAQRELKALFDFTTHVRDSHWYELRRKNTALAA
jgi:hypothetical protein